MRFFAALFYPFRDRNWPAKLGTGLLISAIPFFGFFMIKGWEFETSVRVWRGDAAPLAGWQKKWNHFDRGLTVRLMEMFFNIPTYILITLSVISWVRLFRDVFRLPDPTWAAFAELFKAGLVPRLVLMAGIVFYALAANFFYWAGYLRYVETREFVVFFDFIENTLLAFRNFWDDFAVAIYTTILSVILWGVGSLITALLAPTGIGAFLFGILMKSTNFTIMSYFKGHLMGQLTERTIPPPPRQKVRTR